VNILQFCSLKTTEIAMAEIIRMPRLSDTMEEGVIVGWQKKVGDKVKPGDILAEVETDKATMELESFHEGYLLYIGVPSGPVAVDGIIAVIGAKDEAYEHLLTVSPTATNTKSPEAPPSAASPATPIVTSASSSTTESAITQSEDTRVKASPLARKLAAEAGIALSNIAGSGEQGRIIRKDVTEAVQNKGSFAPSVSTGGYEEVAVSQMRKTIARRLSESKFTAPHFYLTMEISMDKAIEARQSINQYSGHKTSFNDLVVKATAIALKQHPAVNSSWLGDKIRYNKDINIGVAVAVEDGLLVPVIRHADSKSLRQLNEEIRQQADKAKSKKLSPEEMSGNTFTISNLGMFGIDEFTAIINPPDACILAVGGIITKPVVKEGQIVVGNTMKVTLSCDHRVVDGATGAKFLQTLRDLLEDPVRLLA
jgi:pyruvate dehydrogenase E2 component (dihydrolipoamide acetyltransferase)